jgi:hypothetical protein
MTGVFHILELLLVELRAVDISPVEAGRVHGEAGSDGAVGADAYG